MLEGQHASLKSRWLHSYRCPSSFGSLISQAYLSNGDTRSFQNKKMIICFRRSMRGTGPMKLDDYVRSPMSNETKWTCSHRSSPHQFQYFWTKWTSTSLSSLRLVALVWLLRFGLVIKKFSMLSSLRFLVPYNANLQLVSVFAGISPPTKYPSLKIVLRLLILKNQRFASTLDNKYYISDKKPTTFIITGCTNANHTRI